MWKVILKRMFTSGKKIKKRCKSLNLLGFPSFSKFFSWYTEIKNYHVIRQLSSISEVVLIYHTNEFSYSKNEYASFEKAFVDLYYEVTRRQYPLPIQELVRIYRNMKRRISLDTRLHLDRLSENAKFNKSGYLFKE